MLIPICMGLNFINPFFNLLERFLDGIVPPLIFGPDKLCCPKFNHYLDATMKKNLLSQVQSNILTHSIDAIIPPYVNKI